MIFVSSSCVKHDFIKDSVKELADAGFKNIELSGGTIPYIGFENDLLELKAKYSLNYRCHNYYPPPTKAFVLNLASLDNDIYEMSYSHVLRALELSQLLGALKYAVHAGFLINIGVHEIGKSIPQKPLFEKDKSEERFLCAIKELSSKTQVSLYIENNVLNKRNFDNYEKTNPLLMTNSQEILKYLKLTECNFLLDIAHLKVSVETLGLDIYEELSNLLPKTDYIHVSDNDGTKDSNDAFRKDSKMFDALSSFDIANKDFTVEVYSGLSNVMSSYQAIEDLING